MNDAASTSDASKTQPEVFSEATKSGLSAINGTALLTCTVVSAVLSLYAELPGTGAPEVVGYLAIAAWLAGLTLMLFLAGRSAGATGLRASVVRGAAMARGNLRFTAVVLLLMGGAALTVWSRATSERGARADLRQVRVDASAIKAAVTRVVPPAEALARLGFGSSVGDVCRAFSAGNTEALKLFAKIGGTTASVSEPAGQGIHVLCIELLLLSAGKTPDIDAMLTILPIPARDLNRLHYSAQLGLINSGPIALPPLLKGAGVASDAGAQLQTVYASPLMFAVWGGNLAAAQALLKAGADPNQGAKLDVMRTFKPLSNDPLVYSLTVTPLLEARRLGHAGLIEALVVAGARAKVQKVDQS